MTILTLKRLRLRRRLGYWTPSMAEVAAGAAFLAVGTGLLGWNPVPGLESFKSHAIQVVTIVGLLLVAAGWVRRTPAHTYEQAWVERWNALRAEARPFADALDTAWFDWRVRTTHEWRGTDQPRNWRDIAARVWWPDVTERPLRDWAGCLAHHAPDETRQFYAFLKAIERLAEVVKFRQFAVDTYDFFGRRIDDTGVESFLIDVGARDGFRDIMLALAYLNFAVAIRQSSPDPGNVQSGFWSLGARWYPRLLRCYT